MFQYTDVYINCKCKLSIGQVCPKRLPGMKLSRHQIQRAFLLVIIGVILFHLLFTRVAGAANPITVISYNMRYGRDDQWEKNLKMVIDVLKAERPDIVALQEVYIQDIRKIARALGLAYFQSVECYPQTRSKGMGILSRWPLSTSTYRFEKAATKRLYTQAKLMIKGHPLSVYNVHLSRTGIPTDIQRNLAGLKKMYQIYILEKSEQSPRFLEVQDIVGNLKKDKNRFKLVLGDFNTFTGSRPYDEMRLQLEDAFEQYLFSPGTYRSISFFQPKIDHIFHSQALHMVDRNIIEKGNSDHFPIVASFVMLNLDVRGLTRKTIGRVQTALLKNGFSPGEIDSILGPNTRTAVSLFQASKNLPVDGSLTKETLEELLGKPFLR